MSTKKRLARSRTDRMLGGVCAGIAEYFDIDPTLVRLGFVLLILIGVGSPFLLYLILWVVMPAAKQPDPFEVVGELEVDTGTQDSAEEKSEEEETSSIAQS